MSFISHVQNQMNDAFSDDHKTVRIYASCKVFFTKQLLRQTVQPAETLSSPVSQGYLLL